MKYKKKEYLVNKPAILKAYNEKGINHVTQLCAIIGLPLVVAFSYILEYNEDVEVRETMERLMKYYGVDVE